MAADGSFLAVLAIAMLGVAGMLTRPFATPAALWPSAAAVVLVLSGLAAPAQAGRAVLAGSDVYLFLVGMMLLAEMAREEGLFDWLAVHATRMAQGSLLRLFVLVYALGTLVTIFLSNDATAVVLTPAVAAVVRTARVSRPLPYLFACAFIANAASFVLPISNPANLVIYGAQLPALPHWLGLYLVPSVAAIGVTIVVHAGLARADLRVGVASEMQATPLTPGSRRVAVGILLTAVTLLIASSLRRDLGLPTALAAALTALWVAPVAQSGWGMWVRGIAWEVLLLVAGLFVLVGALDAHGAIQVLAGAVDQLAARQAGAVVWIVGLVLGVGCNLVNNLPAGLLAGHVASAAHWPEPLRSSVLLGIDLGPNLSVTGSLATILWLHALRREGLHVRAWDFFKTGAVLMPVALVAALATVTMRH